jgi:UDP-glucose:(heptosyl)LPS alpha-1,3-glucosyltransferase
MDREREPAAESIRSACDVTVVANDIGPVGGMERQLVQLVTGLRRLGHDVTVIARTCDLPANQGVNFRRVWGPRRPALLAYPWFTAVASLMLRRRPHGVVQATGAIVLNRVDVIAVHYCHQVGPAIPSRGTALFRTNAKAVGLMSRIAERLCFRANDSTTFVCVSEGVAGEVREHFPRLADRVVSIQNGVDIERFAPGIRKAEASAMRAALRIGEERLVALFVGSEWDRKGLEPALQALALSPEWDLLVVGSGDRRRYEERAASLGIDKAVHWLGVSRDVQLVYQLADALVFPTSYEAFSLVTLEAAASGLPILATPVSGVGELITDGDSGFVITQEPRMIAERLRQLAADPDLRASMGRAARQSALEFSWEKMVARHHELYSRLANGSNTSGA